MTKKVFMLRDICASSINIIEAAVVWLVFNKGWNPSKSDFVDREYCETFFSGAVHLDCLTNHNCLAWTSQGPTATALHKKVPIPGSGIVADLKLSFFASSFHEIALIYFHSVLFQVCGRIQPFIFIKMK
jgi:hypothetical protein